MSAEIQDDLSKIQEAFGDKLLDDPNSRVGFGYQISARWIMNTPLSNNGTVLCWEHSLSARVKGRKVLWIFLHD